MVLLKWCLYFSTRSQRHLGIIEWAALTLRERVYEWIRGSGTLPVPLFWVTTSSAALESARVGISHLDTAHL